jgi:hypothetical protein
MPRFFSITGGTFATPKLRIENDEDQLERSSLNMPIQVSCGQLRQRRIEPVHDGRVNNDHIRVRFYYGCDTNQGGKVLNRALNGARRT